MIFDFGKPKNSISSSCISRKSITSHTKLCNSVRHFYYRLGRAATAMRAQMSKMFGHGILHLIATFAPKRVGARRTILQRSLFGRHAMLSF